MRKDFRSAFGCPMQEYILNRRLTRARELIQEGTAPADACYSCGFDSYSGFAKAYQGKFGAAPRAMSADAPGYNVLSDFLPE